MRRLDPKSVGAGAEISNRKMPFGIEMVCCNAVPCALMIVISARKSGILRSTTVPFRWPPALAETRV